MKIASYQIDMINVKAADAFLIHMVTDDGIWYNVLVDAGNYSDGDTILQKFSEWYPNEYIDLAIVTHPDADHYGGFVRLLEKIRDDEDDSVKISKFWINDPGNNHIDKNEVKWITKQKSVNVRARSVYDLDDNTNLIDLIDELNIDREEKFAQSELKDNKWTPIADEEFTDFYVIGPKKNYFEKLLKDFRNDELNFFEKEDDSNYKEEDDVGEGDSLSKTLDEAKEDTSAHNKSSIIFVFEPKKGKKYLFMGDASIESFDNMLQSGKDFCANVTWLKVPHHGSKHNLNSRVIKHINPTVSYISTEKIGKYLNQCTVNALKRNGSSVYSTHKQGSMLHNGDREGYTTATPL